MALQVVEFGLEVELEQVVITSRVRDVMSFWVYMGWSIDEHPRGRMRNFKSYDPIYSKPFLYLHS
jgi:hypothetical protein